MKALTCRVRVFVLAAGLVVNTMAGLAFAQTPEQQAAPQEQAAAKEPATTQPTISRFGPEPAPAIAPFDAEKAKWHQEAWAAHLGVPVELTNSIGMKFVLIPPGEFMMGSPAYVSAPAGKVVTRGCTTPPPFRAQLAISGVHDGPELMPRDRERADTG